MICVPNITICKFDHVYLNIELFGETQRTKLLHPIFPITTREEFNFEKQFWSPQTVEEVYKLLKESPVSMELRLLKSGNTESKLLAFADHNAHELLLARLGSETDSEKGAGRSVHVHDTVLNLRLADTPGHQGPSPRVKLNVKSTVFSTPTPVLDELLRCDGPPYCCVHDTFQLKRNQTRHGGRSVALNTCEMFSCDCELHRGKENTQHCSQCHQNYREPGPHDDARAGRMVDWGREEDLDEDYRDHKEPAPTRELRPPFVVRKVPNSLVGRAPDAYDSVYNTVVRESTQPRSAAGIKKLHRLRSLSPDKRGSTKDQDVCFACKLTSGDVRISCDACNLTHRGEPSYRGCDLVRPEAPSLRTHRETTDQRPIFTSTHHGQCKLCARSQRENEHKKTMMSEDWPLLTSTQPLYRLHGYRDMAKYFDPAY